MTTSTDRESVRKISRVRVLGEEKERGQTSMTRRRIEKSWEHTSERQTEERKEGGKKSTYRKHHNANQYKLATWLTCGNPMMPKDRRGIRGDVSNWET